MALPTAPVTLTVEQIAQLNQTLSRKRHEVNNDLAVIGSAIELIRMNPSQTTRMLDMIAQRVPTIKAHISELSAELERALGITRTPGSSQPVSGEPTARPEGMVG